MQQLASKNCKWAVEINEVTSKNRDLCKVHVQTINRLNAVFARTLDK